MSDTENLEIKKRARRRLVGAVALALLAIIVLPMVMDSEPLPMSQDIQISIPDRNADSTVARPLASDTLSDAVSGDVLPPPEQDDVTPPPVAARPTPPPAPSSPPAATTGTPPAPKVATAPPAPARPDTPPKPAQTDEAARVQAILSNNSAAAAPAAPALKGIFILQLGAFSDTAKAEAMVQALKAQNLPTYTEKAGAVTRVRVGPYTSRAEAEQVATRLQAQGRYSVIAAR